MQIRKLTPLLPEITLPLALHNPGGDLTEIVSRAPGGRSAGRDLLPLPAKIPQSIKELTNPREKWHAVCDTP
jgi:hypothetical protein